MSMSTLEKSYAMSLCTAMIDELDYFHAHVWRADTIEHTKSAEDPILIRSRWVIANKGDAAKPDVRARLVGCEVNKGGKKRRRLCLNSSLGGEAHDV